MSSTKSDTPILAERYDQLSDTQFDNGKLLIKELQIKNGHHVLDIGSGTGRLAEYVAKTVGKKGKVFGIDPSPHRVKVASIKVKPPLNLSFEVGSGDDLSHFKIKALTAYI
jgi:ubiquinone/menaquinone biosynthesis C-methylase UbiE